MIWRGPARMLALSFLLLLLGSCGQRIHPMAPTSDAQGTDPIEALGYEPVRFSAMGSPIRAAYFYSYMPFDHLDRLAEAGFNRAIVKFIGSSMGPDAIARLKAWMARGARVSVEVAPTWNLAARGIASHLPNGRRYAPEGRIVPEIGCPLDPELWDRALIGRAEDILRAVPDVKRMVVDMEVYGVGFHFYDRACRCARCMREFRQGMGYTTAMVAAMDEARLARRLTEFQEKRLRRMLEERFKEFRDAHPGVEMGFFDLDRNAFVHRAMAEALDDADLQTVDYTERTYRTGARDVPVARDVLTGVGLSAPVVAGVWLKGFTPAALSPALQSVLQEADGYFVFTTYSLWRPEVELSGPYSLRGHQDEYWRVFKTANGVAP